MLVIGDQLLTDVLGAKRMGFTVLWGTFVTGEGISNDKNYKANRKNAGAQVRCTGLLPEERK